MTIRVLPRFIGWLLHILLYCYLNSEAVTYISLYNEWISNLITKLKIKCSRLNKCAMRWVSKFIYIEFTKISRSRRDKKQNWK